MENQSQESLGEEEEYTEEGSADEEDEEDLSEDSSEDEDEEDEDENEVNNDVDDEEEDEENDVDDDEVDNDVDDDEEENDVDDDEEENDVDDDEENEVDDEENEVDDRYIDDEYDYEDEGEYDDDDDGTELSESDVVSVSISNTSYRSQDDEVDNRSKYSGGGSEDGENKDNLKVIRELGPAIHLSEEEKIRALRVFKHCCDTYDDNALNAEQFSVALALLGQIETQDKVKELFDKHEASTRKITVNKKQFLLMFDGLRTKTMQEEVLQQIEVHFNNLYEGMCDDDSNKDTVGGRFLLVSKFRELLTSQGDVLTDEEADEIIIECQPRYELDEDGTKIGKIYYDGYRTMILDSSFQLANNKPKSVFNVGSRVETNFKGRGKWLPGKIKSEHGDGTYDIAYENGVTETRVEKEMIRIRKRNQNNRKSMIGKTVTDFVSMTSNMFA